MTIMLMCCVFYAPTYNTMHHLSLGCLQANYTEVCVRLNKFRSPEAGTPDLSLKSCTFRFEALQMFRWCFRRLAGFTGNLEGAGHEGVLVQYFSGLLKKHSPLDVFDRLADLAGVAFVLNQGIIFQWATFGDPSFSRFHALILTPPILWHFSVPMSPPLALLQFCGISVFRCPRPWPRLHLREWCLHYVYWPRPLPRLHQW